MPMTHSTGPLRPGRATAALAVAAALALLVGCGSGGGAKTPTASPAATARPARTVPPIPAASQVVTHPTVWLCRPGMANNPCDGGLDATVVQKDLSTSTETFRPARNAPIDCFYVYPTTSEASGVNAPARPEPAVIRTTRAQAGRFAQVCRLYVPIYRQVTLRALLKPGAITPAAIKLATGDVVSAWHDYLAHYNHGRGVVLIGHSQGAAQLKSLITTEIDNTPAERSRLVSALLMGGNVQVPSGKDVGGDFSTIPACRRTDQTACVVAYSTYDRVPPAGGIFGRDTGSTATTPLRTVLCVNPAALGGGRAQLHPYLPNSTLGGTFLPGAGRGALPNVSTGFLSTPGLVHAECRSQNGFTWLQIDDHPAAGDKRPTVPGKLPPTWGLHALDVNIALGDLVSLVGEQAVAWQHS